MASKEEVQELGIHPTEGNEEIVFWRGAGCNNCLNTGYKGRMGIHEVMMPTDELRQLILQNVDSGSIKKRAMAQGMATLREDGAIKVMAGITSSAEVLRVTGEDSA